MSCFARSTRDAKRRVEPAWEARSATRYAAEGLVGAAQLKQQIAEVVAELTVLVGSMVGSNGGVGAEHWASSWYVTSKTR